MVIVIYFQSLWNKFCIISLNLQFITLWPSNSIHRCMYRRISPMCARVTYRNVSHISVQNSKCVKTRYLSLNPRNKLTMISKGITFEYLRYLYILKATQFWHIHIISLFNVCMDRINPKLRYRIKVL